MGVRTGLDRVADPDVRSRLHGRAALLAHPASVDRDLRHAEAVLDDQGVDLRLLFGPEHGYGGEAQDMIGVVDEGRARPVRSLYGHTFESLTPRAEDLADLDVLIVDLQDVGSRYYTYVWTAALAMKAAAAAGVRTVVLDRPNPLNGVDLEAAPQREGFRSFVGLYDVPTRHGMTLGELCRMVRELDGLDEAALDVIPMEGWSRAQWFDETGLPWVLPSPNMPTLDTATVYPGGCLLEGTTLSEGRGQTRPFEIGGAPGLDGAALARVPTAGATLRPLSFQPTFQKHAGVRCGGVQVHVTDRTVFRSVDAYRRWLVEAARLLGDGFAWRPDPYEFVGDVPAIDLLGGGPELRSAVDAHDPSLLDDLEAADRVAEAAFAERREPWLLYR